MARMEHDTRFAAIVGDLRRVKQPNEFSRVVSVTWEVGHLVSRITSAITEPETAIVHFNTTRKSGFACIALLSRALAKK